MKLSRIIKTSLFAAVFTLGSAAVAATVNLSGTVASTANVTAVATSSAGALDMGGEGVDIGQQIVKVADVTMSTNNATGLTLTVTSGDLSNGTDSVAYQVTTVADEAAAPVGADFTVPSGTDYTYSNSTSGSEDRDLYIAYTPPILLDPGTYTGTITLTVADN
ncbi:MAG: hypothetical protein IRZ16_14840 [Myxococcaceae bacterium]|nr:hypothetical protein [Myxococcaceae bacterium]